jgi:hypothetical protein
MLQASLFDLLLNIALPVCPLHVLSHGSHLASSLVPTAAAGESCMRLQWCFWQACQTSIACAVCGAAVQPHAKHG